MKLKLLLTCGLCLFVLNIFAQLPQITSFTPTSNASGPIITITGSNLANAKNFTVGGWPGIIISNTQSQLVGYILQPVLAGLMDVSVITPSGTATASAKYDYENGISVPQTSQSEKLVGSGAIGSSVYQGRSVAMSIDGSTLIVGGDGDNNNQGAAWVFAKTAGVWAQQGSKLVGSGGIGSPAQGTSVAISGDGNTAVLGAPGDNGNIGAIWVFTRSGSTWTQQGNKLTVTGGNGAPLLGTSVAISFDGNTIIAGGPGDDGAKGAVWAFGRTNNVWAQQGNKLIGKNYLGASQQGTSVSICGNGSVFVEGGPGDNGDQGAAWTFVRSSGTWAQLGDKFLGKGNVGAARQGQSVAISIDVNTSSGVGAVLIGGPADDNGQGAIWQFWPVINNIWLQIGNKFLAADNIGAAKQGSSVNLNVGVVGGGVSDNNNLGAAWTFAGGPNYNTDKTLVAVNKLVGTGGVGATVNQGAAVSGAQNTIVSGGPQDNNGLGAVWVHTFIPSQLPVVLTGNATNVTAVAAILSGELTGNVNAPTTVTIEYSTAADLSASTNLTLTTGTTPVPAGSKGISYRGTATSLLPNTKYYFRITASNVFGTSYGNILNFTTLNSPTITSFTPTSAFVGATVTITGTNLNNVTSVSFGGTTASSFNIVSPTTVTAIVANGTAGSVSVVANGVTTSLPGFVFLQKPEITYPTKSPFTIGTAITPFGPSNRGGAVPGNAYGLVTTLAGSGVHGYADGTGTAAAFYVSGFIASDAAGNVYVADAGNNVIRKVTPSGVVTTLAGSASAQGATDGIGSAARFYNPRGMAVNTAGEIFVADYYNHKIRKISSTGQVTTLVNGSSVGLSLPSAIAIDPSTGDLFVTSEGSHRIYRVTASGVTTIFAGSGVAGLADGLGTAASFNTPKDIKIDASGNLFVADYGNNMIRKITKAGVVTMFSGNGLQGAVNGSNLSASFNKPSGLAIDVMGNIYVGDSGNNLIRLISAAGTVSTFAGTGAIGSANGDANKASFYEPQGLTLDNQGSLYVGDNQNGLVRKILVTGYAISPALPAGLNFDTATGIISGVPRSVTSPANYTVSAYNLYGGSTDILNLSTVYGVPNISSFSLTVAIKNANVTITGTSFTDATGVSFGGTAAASFTVVSDTQISAVVGTGSTGSVSVTTPGGVSTKTGFIFVPVPTVTAGGPTTIQTGGSVTLTVSPGVGFVYQWIKDGVDIPAASLPTYVATQGGSYTVRITYGTVSQTSSTTVVTSVFALPPNNFRITNTSATCKGSANGSINITATQSLSYTATITGGAINSSYPFTTTQDINNLPAGTYNVCITVAGQPAYEQCYTAVITEPKDLALYSAVIQGGNQVVLSLGGSTTYNINVNGNTTVTNDNQVTLKLNSGVNSIVISTDKVCQGQITKTINLSGDKVIYPNPVENMAAINLGPDNIKVVTIKLYDAFSRLAYSKQYANQSGTVPLDMTGLTPGVYMLNLSTDGNVTAFKIIKK